MSGTLAKDQISFLPSPNSGQIGQNIDFLMVTRADDLDNLLSDGLIGLGPSTPAGRQYTTLLQQFYNQNLISHNMFTMLLAKTGTQSTIWIGGYDPQVVRSLLSIQYSK